MGRGRGRGKRTMSRDFRTRKDGTWNDDAKRTKWDDNVTGNKDFDEYYKAQGICPPEEWDAFTAILAVPLPLTFRINGGGRFADDLRRKLESDFLSEFASDGPIMIDDEAVNPPLCLPWYPHGLGWQLEFSRTQLRKVPKLEALHEFMKRETEVGAITRQEAVSMVPPLFLDVRPHHRVLDMCAAPGSKTVQLLEALHVDGVEPVGVVVANDADAQRCNMLTHQTQRIRSPAMLVCNHEAQSFPLIWDLDPASADVKVLFDRVLADVPCSGDGTIRKQPDIWRRWSAASGNGLHILQLRIALRACELLRVGGRMVYSTCTFNPIEDEAVVAEVLRRAKGAMELVDVSGELPALRRCPGLHTWKVRDRTGAFYSTWEEGKLGYKLDPSMFPGPADEGLPLERCMRYLPHHQNTGGFFVAVLQKVKDLDGLEYPTMDHRAVQAKAAADEKWKQKRAEKAAAAAAVEGGAAEGGAAAPNEEAAAAVAEVAATAEPMDADEATAPAPTLVPTPAPAVEPMEEAVHEPAAALVGDAGEGDGPSSKPRWKRAPEKVLPEWGIRGGGARNRADGDANASTAAANAAASAAAADGKKEKVHRGRWRGIDPIIPVTDPEILGSIRSFYGLGPECGVPDALIARSNEERPKKLTHINSGAKLLLQMDVREQIKVTAAGVKVFDRQDDKHDILACNYRLAQEGLPCLLPFITRQRFQPTLSEFMAILKERIVGLPTECKVHITKLKDTVEDTSAAAGDGGGGGGGEAANGGTDAEPAAAAAAGAEPAAGDDAAPAPAAAPEEAKKHTRTTLSDALTLEHLGKVDYGCCVATLRPADLVSLGFADEGATAGAEAMFAIACWRGRGNLNVLVSRQECSQMVDRLEAAAAAAAAAAG